MHLVAFRWYGSSMAPVGQMSIQALQEPQWFFDLMW